MVKVLEAIPGDAYTLNIKLDNGKIRVFDVAPFLEKGIFTELKNTGYFKLVKVRGRSVSWPHSQDFCADTIESLMK
jgi:hypothetical protein